LRAAPGFAIVRIDVGLNCNPEAKLAVNSALIPEGTRVRVRRGALPLDPSVIGRTGTVADTSEYRAQSYGVILDDEVEIRYFAPDELEVIEERALPPDRLAAKQRRALP